MTPRSAKGMFPALLLFAALLVGCGGGGTPTATAPTSLGGAGGAVPPTATTAPPPVGAASGAAPTMTPEPPQTSSTVTSDQSTRAVRSNAPAASAQPDAAIAAMEREVVQRINAIRTERGLGALQPDQTLMQVAHDYSCLMARQDFFSHTGPTGDTVADRVQEAGISYRLVGENLARNTNAPQPVEAAVQGWMDSDEHRANILRPDFTMTGVGVCREGDRYFFTQVFLQPR